MSSGFWFIKKGSGDSNILCMYAVSCIDSDVFQNGDLNFSQMATTEGGTPKFSRQNDRRECSLDYPDGFGHFLFSFVAGGGNTLGKTRVKNAHFTQRDGPLSFQIGVDIFPGY